MVWRSG